VIRAGAEAMRIWGVTLRQTTQSSAYASCDRTQTCKRCARSEMKVSDRRGVCIFAKLITQQSGTFGARVTRGANIISRLFGVPVIAAQLV
jgi:hypothetical protein